MVTAAKLLEQVVVTMIAPAALRRHRERGGESPPPYSSSSPPRWEEGSLLVHGLHGGEEPLRDWICLSVLFCFTFLFSGPSPFLKFLEIRNSDCVEILTRFFSGYMLHCARSRAPTDIQGGHNPPPRAWAAWGAQVSCGGCGPPFALIPPPKNHIYSKIIYHKFLSRLDFV